MSADLATVEAMGARPVHELAGQPGVYFLFRGGSIVYIGQTGNIPVRVYGGHWRGVGGKADRPWDVALGVPVPRADLDAIERQHILRFLPTYNVTGIPERVTAVRRRQTEQRRAKVAVERAKAEESRLHAALLALALLRRRHALGLRRMGWPERKTCGGRRAWAPVIANATFWAGDDE